MRRILPLTAALLTIVGLGGCAPSAESADQSGDGRGGTTLTVWSWQQPLAAQWDKVFARYEQQHPDIDVQFKGFEDYDTVLKTGLSGDKGPDVVMLHPYTSLTPYVKAGQLKQISPADIPGLSAFTKESIASATSEGNLYGVPFAQQSVQVFYNKDLFAKVGVSPPRTAAEVQPLLDRLSAAEVVPFAVTGKDAWQLVNVFDALVGTEYGGAQFVEKVRAGTASFTDPAFVRALTRFKALQKYFPPNVAGVTYADSQALFNSGRAAMFPGGSWELQTFRDAKPAVNVGVFSMPAVDGSAPTWGYEDGSFGISARTTRPREALDLLKWMATADFGQPFTEHLKQASSVPGVQPTDPVLAEMVANYRKTPVPMIWVTDYFGVSSPAPYAALMNASQNLLVGKTTPPQAAGSIQESVGLFTKQQTD